MAKKTTTTKTKRATRAKHPTTTARASRRKAAPATKAQPVWRKPVPAAKPMKITGPLNQMALAEVVGTDTGLPPETVKAVQQATWDAVARTLAGGHNVTITNFGCWKAYRRRKYQARNPQTGEMVMVPAHWAMTFKISPRLADLVRAHKPGGATVRKHAKGTLTPPAQRPGDLP